MKTRFLILVFILSGLISSDQKYEAWVYTPDSNQGKRGVFESFNDSALFIRYKRSLLTFDHGMSFQTPFITKGYVWDNVNILKMRNIDINKKGRIIGILVGAGVGFLISNFSKNEEPFKTFEVLIGIGVYANIGALVGHLITSEKITIPLYGKNAIGKSQALRDFFNYNKK